MLLQQPRLTGNEGTAGLRMAEVCPVRADGRFYIVTAHGVRRYKTLASMKPCENAVRHAGRGHIEAGCRMRIAASTLIDAIPVIQTTTTCNDADLLLVRHLAVD